MPMAWRIRSFARAIMLNAWEENRHKEVLGHLVRAYGIALAEEPPYLLPRDREFAFLVTGDSRIHRQLLRLRALRAGQAIGLLSSRARRYVRARDPGGMSPHPVLRQLAGVAPRQLELVASPVVRAAGRGVPGSTSPACASGWARSVGTNNTATQQANNFTVNGAQAVTAVEIGFLDLYAGLPAGERAAAGRR